MAEYLDREEVLNCFHDWIDKHGDVHTADEMSEFRAIEALEPADVAPVIHGTWMRYGYDGSPNEKDTVYWQCDQCLTTQMGRRETAMKYCPNCGARMDGENETD